MTEVLFVLTVIYVAYVFYVTISDKKAQIKAAPPEEFKISVPSSIEPFTQKEPPKPIKATVAKQPAVPKQATHKKGLKDPKTGDIATTYSNYIFTKRWIKEALVSEGLLEKIYKNKELTAEVEASIKVAIAKLEAMEQYKV
jgi:hypothetical protein